MDSKKDHTTQSKTSVTKQIYTSSTLTKLKWTMQNI